LVHTVDAPPQPIPLAAACLQLIHTHTSTHIAGYLKLMVAQL
jgi:hypothetical protein